jgi:hypothetical protein
MCLPFLIPETVPELKAELIQTKAEYNTVIEKQKAELELLQSQQEDLTKTVENQKKRLPMP